MTSPLVYVLAFVVALGVLITVHEFGHFWVAKRLGVKVLRFSVGFGRSLWSWRSKNGETEYTVAAIPLGGYVKMLDEREGEVAPEELGRAFNRKPVGTRIAVVAAGPAFNFVFAVIAFWVMFLIGVPGLAPLVGQVEQGSIADRAGFQEGERIVAIAGQPTPTWERARLALFEAALARGQLSVEVEAPDGGRARRELDFSGKRTPLEPQGLIDELGIDLWRPPAVLGEIQPGGPAEQAGLQQDDRVVSAGGEPVETWSDWVRVVRANPGQAIEVTIERGGQRRVFEVVPDRRQDEGGEIGFVGVGLPQGIVERMFAVERYGPIGGFGAGVAKTWDMSVLMLRVLGNILTGHASVRNISGPLTIAQYAGETASLGVLPFLSFLAVVSVSLGVLNLLPIPILDGGHLMYYLIEFVKGSPVSEQAQALGQRVGILLLLMLMGLAFYNDFLRLFQ